MVKVATDYRVLLNYLFNPVHFTSPTNIAVVLTNREYQNPYKWSVKYMTMLVMYGSYL